MRLVSTRILLAGVLLALVVFPWLSAQRAAAQGGNLRTVSPLPVSDYSVRPVCAAPGDGYAEYLEMWGNTFEQIGDKMEIEWNSNRRYPNVYLVDEWYLHIPLLGDFPETYHYEECAYERYWRSNGREYTIYRCPTGRSAAEGHHHKGRVAGTLPTRIP